MKETRAGGSLLLIHIPPLKHYNAGPYAGLTHIVKIVFYVRTHKRTKNHETSHCKEPGKNKKERCS